MYRIAFIFLLFCCSVLQIFGQSRFLISQYMYNGLVLNPAYAGSQQQFSLATTYRNQWLNVEGAPTFQMISAHTPVFSNRIGMGMLISAEQVGVHKEYTAFASFAYKVKLTGGYLAFGLSGGLSQKLTDYSTLRVFQVDDPYLQGTGKNLVPNFGVGVYFYNGSMYAGFSVPYLLNPNRLDGTDARANSILRDIRSYYFTSGFLLGEKYFRVNPSFLIRMRERTPLAADINVNLIFLERVILGGSYRVNAGFVLLSQLILNHNFRVMYAYDLTTSSLSHGASGTHEIMLNYRIVIRSLVKDPHCTAYF